MSLPLGGGSVLALPGLLSRDDDHYHSSACHLWRAINLCQFGEGFCDIFHYIIALVNVHHFTAPEEHCELYAVTLFEELF